jgi:hypothetical protein
VNPVLTYVCGQIPSVTDARLKRAVGMDVSAKCGDAWESLLGFLAIRPPGTVSVSLRSVLYGPEENRTHTNRLQLHVAVQCATERDAAAAAPFLDTGALNVAYALEHTEDQDDFWGYFRHSCHILRRLAFPAPSIGRESNPGVPGGDYFVPHVLTPRKPDTLDFAPIDQVLDAVRERVCIVIAVTAADITAERIRLSKLLSDTQRVNHAWGIDDAALLVESDLGIHDTAWSGFSRRAFTREQDPVADLAMRELRRVHENMVLPHLSFTVSVLSESRETAPHVAAVLASHTLEEGNHLLLTMSEGDGAVFGRMVETLRQGGVPALPVLERCTGLENRKRYADYENLASLATVEELQSLFRFPVARETPLRCVRKSTSPPRHESENMLVVGRLADSCLQTACKSDVDQVGILADDAPKHAVVGGKPGSGKTELLIGLLIQLLLLGIPFLVICCAKNEFRALKVMMSNAEERLRKALERLEFYTAGAEQMCPLRLNPFGIFQHVPKAVQVSLIHRCLGAMIATGAPLFELLLAAIERVVFEHEGSRPATFPDLIKGVDQVVKDVSYGHETQSDMQGALKARLECPLLGATAAMFHGPVCVPDIPHLAQSQSVIELGVLPDEQEASTVLFLLTGLSEYFKARPWNAKGARYVIVVGEAHVIARGDVEARPSDEAADPLAYAGACLSRQMREFRAMGVSLFILDQSFKALPRDFLKNAGSVAAMRLTEPDEVAVASDILGLSALQAAELPLLQPGQGLFSAPDYTETVRIQTEDLRKKYGARVPDDAETFSIFRDEKWFPQATDRRCAAEIAYLLESAEPFESSLIATQKEAIRLLSGAKGAGPLSGTQCKAIRALQNCLAESLRELQRGPFRYLWPSDEILSCCTPETLAAFDLLNDTVRIRIPALVKDVMARLEKRAAEPDEPKR